MNLANIGNICLSQGCSSTSYSITLCLKIDLQSYRNYINCTFGFLFSAKWEQEIQFSSLHPSDKTKVFPPLLWHVF